MSKPKKKSNFMGFSIAKQNNYIKDVDDDLNSIFSYLDRFPRVYQQSTEPSLADDTWSFWKDTDDSKYYLLLNISGTQKKVELT